MNELILYGALGVIGLFMFFVFVRSGKFFKSFLYSAVSGLFALLVTYGVGLYTVPLLVISPLAVACSVLLGLPGVITLLIVKLFIIF